MLGERKMLEILETLEVSNISTKIKNKIKQTIEVFNISNMFMVFLNFLGRLVVGARPPCAGRTKNIGNM